METSEVVTWSHLTLEDISDLVMPALLTTGWFKGYTVFFGHIFARWPYCSQEKHGPSTGTHDGLGGIWDNKKGGGAT